ncbi:MAG: SOS response-associated peptidase family protein [Pseudomonadota bacterium]
MCVNYRPLNHEDLIKIFDVNIAEDAEWPKETYQDYFAPIIRSDSEGKREAFMASFGMIPKQHTPSNFKRFSTMNARAETVGELRSYKSAWSKHQFCLVPMYHFYEPNWETGKHIRYAIGMANHSPFAVAGLWRDWKEEDGGISHSFTQLTINADVHPLMKRFHKPDDEKRSLVIIYEEDYDDWLQCDKLEEAQLFLRNYPAELMEAWPMPKESKSKK